MLIQNLYGNDENLYNIIRPAAKDILRDDIRILFYSVDGEYDTTIQFILDTRAFKNIVDIKKHAENKRTVILCNRTWHDFRQTGYTDKLAPYLRGIGCNTGSSKYRYCVNMDSNLREMGERFVKYKNGPVLASMLVDNISGCTFIYLASYVDLKEENQSGIKYLRDVFTKFSLSGFNADIFSSKVKEKRVDAKKTNKELTFNSIDDVCKKHLEGTDKQSIIEEMLDKVDYKNLVPLFNAYLKRDNRNLPILQKDYLRRWLGHWAEAKWKLYLLFGRNFYIKSCKDIKKDRKMLAAQLSELKYSFPEYALVLNSFAIESFDENSTANCINSDLFEYKPCPNKMKLSKYLAGLFHNPKFDVQLSSIIQDNFVKANLTISIDPFDYMTSSINKNGWRSCHNIYDGEYKKGPISYMMDTTSMVGYLSNEKIYEYTLGNFKFKGNSKICRQIIHMGTDTNIMIFNRLYPQHYVNEEIYAFIRSVLEETTSKFCNIENHWKTKKSGAKFEGCYKNMSRHHYDDICGNETMLVKHKGFKGSLYTIPIGSNIICPICNKEVIYSNTICNNCFQRLKNVESLDLI